MPGVKWVSAGQVLEPNSYLTSRRMVSTCQPTNTLGLVVIKYRDAPFATFFWGGGGGGFSTFYLFHLKYEFSPIT